jgi:catechol 2,3-dioxygenase-like lactoylglutathione lyase family enzyme
MPAFGTLVARVVDRSSVDARGSLAGKRSSGGTVVHMSDQAPVRQLRLCVTAPDYHEALRFYRDVLGLPEQGSYASPDGDGRVTILAAGVATLELADPEYAAYIDQVEVGSRVASHIRVAFEVEDTAQVTATLADAGAEIIAPPTRTPWNSLNARLTAPANLQLTIFAEEDQP